MVESENREGPVPETESLTVSSEEQEAEPAQPALPPIYVHHERVETGCFVFQVVRRDRVLLRSCPELGKDDEDDEVEEESHFEQNELLAVDLIQPGTNATFLRLADQSGWVLAEEFGEIYMRQIPVTTGLYQFYIDQLPQTVRLHPMDDSSELLTSEANAQILQPMQKIYCDTAVEHPVTGVKFYRLQGFSDISPAVAGWVHDKQEEIIKLLEPSNVKTGTLFAYRLLKDETVRSRPDCTEDSKTEHQIKKGEIVVGDLLRVSPYHNGNGPFLRLSDGTGWIFEKKLGFPTMITVPIVAGKWIWTVLNVGIKLRCQPIDSQDNVYEDVTFEIGELIECDRMVVGQNDVNFYRVAGTNGWLFDKRNTEPTMKLLSVDVLVDIEESSKISKSWEPDFVRGIAATVDGVQETIFQKSSEVLTFESSGKIAVKVFCRTHTTCTIFSNFHFFECSNSPASLRKIFNRDLAKTVTAFHRSEAKKKANQNRHAIQEKKKGESPESMRTSGEQEEEDLRQRLITLDLEAVKINDQRREVIAAIKVFENGRLKASTDQNETFPAHSEQNGLGSIRETFLNNKPVESLSVNTNHVANTAPSADQDNPAEEHISDSAGPKMPTSPARSPPTSRALSPPTSPPALSPALSPMSGGSSKTTSSRRVHVCGECSKEFSGKYSRDIHCREVHKLFCAVCDQIFLTSQEHEAHLLEVKHE